MKRLHSALSMLPLRGLAGLAFAAPLAAMTTQAAFTPLGFISEDIFISGATGISADGMTVIGMSAYLGPDDEEFLAGFKWTLSGGMTSLPTGATNSPANYLYGVSADGSVIVGMEILSGGSGIRPYRHTNGSAELLPGTFGFAYGVSGDGVTVVGQNPDGFRWTEVGGTVAIPLLLDEDFNSATAISTDGSTIAGSAELSGGGMRAFRWTVGGGTEALPITGYDVFANAVNADGSTIVGTFITQVGQATIPFAWTEQGVVTMDALSVADGVENTVMAITADGAWAGGSSDDQAVIWNTRNGELILLKDFLIASGITGLDGWELEAVSGMSADGLSLAGSGVNPAGNREGWHVTISAIPEPATITLLLLGSGMALLCRRMIH